MKLRFKLTSLVLVISVALAMCVCLSACSNKNVPVYKGMSISSDKNYEAANGGDYNIHLTSDTQDQPSEGTPGEVVGDTTDKNSSLPPNPFPSNPEGEDIENEVSDSIEVIGPSEDIYYTEQYRDIYVNIHVENPKSYEILSFTFNGVKYSDYMFEKGSDLENIIIKVPIEASTGIIEYTIDAMKYINERNEIKDVIMEGDKTVKAGVWYFNQVVPEIENLETNYNSIEFDVVIYDFDELIEKTGGKAYAVVYDGESLLGYKEIPVPKDENGITVGMPQGHIKIDGLKTGGLYQLGIVGFYDNLKGDGFGLNVLYTQTFRSKDIVLFESFSVGTDGADFGLSWSDGWAGTKELTSLTLFDKDGNETALDTSASEISGLLSGASYTLVAKYNNAEAEEQITVSFTTLGKSAPAFDLDCDYGSDYADISVDFTDEDNTIVSYLIELYCGDELVASASELSLLAEQLEAFTDYKAVFSFVYNTNDGTGNKSAKLEQSFKTAPPVSVTEIALATTDAIRTGDDILLKLTLDNPLRAAVVGVTVSGYSCPIVSSNTSFTTVVVSFDCDAFKGGEETLTVETVSVVKESLEYDIEIEEERSIDIFVNGILSVKSVSLTNSDFERINYLLGTNKAYLVIELDNITGYSIDAISTNLTPDGDLVKVSDSLYYMPVTLSSSGWTDAALYSVEYSNAYLDSALTMLNIPGNSVYSSSAEAVEISTPEQLAAICEGEADGHYVLTQDIDLADYIEANISAGKNGWTPGEFSGILIGNGYKIKNLSIIRTFNNTDVSLGLFASVTGVITDLTLDGVNIVTGLNASEGASYTLSVGALAGKLYSATISDVTVESGSITVVSSSSSTSVKVGGIVGMLDGAIRPAAIIGCTNKATISSPSYAGGIIGTLSSFTEHILEISDCTNSASISGGAVGGIIASTNVSVSILGCKNMGSLQATNVAGGMIAIIEDGTVKIIGCTNSATVSSTSYAAGIAAALYGHSMIIDIIDCINTADITSSGSTAAGIVASNARLGYPTLTIERVENSGNITGSGYAGGIAGCIENGTLTINEAYNSGNVTVASGSQSPAYTAAGGIIALVNSGKITNCMNAGTISGYESVGGIVGYVDNSSGLEISNCINAAHVTASSNYSGGIVGSMYLRATTFVEGNVNLGFVSITGNLATVQKHRGGIVGYARCHAQLYLRRCANMGLGFPAIDGWTDDFLTEKADNVERYEDGAETFDNSEFYSVTLGFDESVWELDSLDVRNEALPSLKFANS